MLYSEDKAVIVTGALLALIASPVEVAQFIFVSLTLDDTTTDGEKASYGSSIGTLCILYAVAAAAVSLNLMLLQSVGHRVAARVRRSLVASVLRQEVSFLFGHNDYILLQTLGSDVEYIRKAVSSQLARWIQACVQVLPSPLTPPFPANRTHSDFEFCSGVCRRPAPAAVHAVLAAGPRPSIRPPHLPASSRAGSRPAFKCCPPRSLHLSQRIARTLTLSFVQVFVGAPLLFMLSWRLALALLSALPIIAIAMVLQVCASHLFCIFPLNLSEGHGLFRLQPLLRISTCCCRCIRQHAHRQLCPCAGLTCLFQTVVRLLRWLSVLQQPLRRQKT